MHTIRSMPLTTSGLSGSFAPPGDKSVSHRAIILGSIADGITTVDNLLEGEDVLSTVAAFRTMGVEITREPEGRWVVAGVGLDGLAEPTNVLDLGNSGTSMRLLAGLLSAQPFLSVLTGDESLRSRPMDRVVKPLSRMGARILGRGGGRLAPLVIQGSELIPMEYQSPVSSAQVKSAILLAGLNTAGATTVEEPELSRDHTERMLAAFGAEVKREGNRVTVDGWAELKGQTVTVPGDFSAAAFPMVAALLTPGSHIRLTGVGVNPTRTGLLDLLLAMGGDITLENQRELSGEPVADLVVRHSTLKGVAVPRAVVARAIDEFPIFFVAAAFAEGETLLTGAEELRVKESDRITAMATALIRIGARLEEREDGLRLFGQPGGLPGGTTVDSRGDHRVAMSMLVAGLVCQEPVTVTRCENIATSFPNFVPGMNALGARLVIPEGA